MICQVFKFFLVAWLLISSTNLWALNSEGFLSSSRPQEATTENYWLGSKPREPFSRLADFEIDTSHFNETIVPYFTLRGLTEADAIKEMVKTDLYNLAHALSAIFAEDHEIILKAFFGPHYQLIEDKDAEIDHIGRELLGPLTFYLSLLQENSQMFGLHYVSHLIFLSTQVVKNLAEEDPEIRGVTIGRIYFRHQVNETIRCLELFQTAMPDGSFPQKVEKTIERLSITLSPDEKPHITPIDHLAIRFGHPDDIKNIHEKIIQAQSEIVRPYQMKVSYNPSDQSTNTKVLFRDSNRSAFNKIVEFISYD